MGLSYIDMESVLRVVQVIDLGRRQIFPGHPLLHKRGRSFVEGRGGRRDHVRVGLFAVVVLQIPIVCLLFVCHFAFFVIKWEKPEKIYGWMICED